MRALLARPDLVLRAELARVEQLLECIAPFSRSTVLRAEVANTSELELRTRELLRSLNLDLSRSSALADAIQWGRDHKLLEEVMES